MSNQERKFSEQSEEGITWPNGWKVIFSNDKIRCYAECPICKEIFYNRIAAHDHNKLLHRPKIILDDGCCSCWTHC